MLISYLKIAVRNLLKNALFSSINIGGMTVSLASCFLIAVFVWDELKFDRYHPDAERTFRVYNISARDGVDSYLPIVPYPFASYMQKDFPEVERTLRIMDTYGELQIEHNGSRILEPGGIYAEPTVFDVLTIEVLAGNAVETLSKANTVALSATLAKKYFPKKDPLGETLRIADTPYEVTAIYEDIGQHSHIAPKFIMSFASTGWDTLFQSNWQRQQIFTYLKLKPGADAKGLEAKLKPFVEKYAYSTIEPLGFSYVPYLQNIRDIHLHSSNFEWEMAKRGNAQMVYVLSGTGLLILVIACLNFINLSTARAVKRTKEVGIRKVAGALRRQLIAQFITESVCITFAALVLALVITEATLPYLNDFTEKDIAIPYTFGSIVSVVAACVMLGTIAGSYPALHLSGFKPSWALQHKSGTTRNTSFFRHGLVALQFVFSFLLIIGASVVMHQHDLLMEKDLGFSKEQLIMIPLHRAHLSHGEATKQAFANHPNILGSTLGFGIPGDISAGDGVIDPVTNKNISTTLYCVDHDYIKTMGMHIVAGRDFSDASPADEQTGFILNETAVRSFGFGDPEKAIGHPLNWNTWGSDSLKRGKVIGVVKDFHFKSLREKLTPVVIQVFPPAFWKITLRVKSGNLNETIAHLKSTYEKIDNSHAFEYKFVDQNFDAMYSSEKKLSALFSIFTGVAIVVACFGLFGLVEYSVNQRVREIGIRKVFGASVRSLLVLLTRKYVLLVIGAFILTIPISYYAADQWLSGFAYHIEINPLIYAQAFALVMLITFFTVIFQSLRAAWTNPSKTLRTE